MSSACPVCDVPCTRMKNAWWYGASVKDDGDATRPYPQLGQVNIPPAPSG